MGINNIVYLKDLINLSNIVYLSEAIIFIMAIIIGVIIIKIKKKKGILKLFGICFALFILGVTTTFCLEKPEMQLSKTQTIEVLSQERVNIPNTYYHFQDITNNVKETDNIDYNKVGEYEAKFEVDTLLGKYYKTSIINVVDTKGPNINLNEDENYKLSYLSEYKEPGFEAIDEYEGNLTDRVVTTREDIDENHFNIKYEVEDSSGNKSEKIRYVTLNDDIAPVLALNGDAVIHILVNGKYEELGASAADEKDGDLTNKIEISGGVDTTKVGTYTIVYKVTDSNGNEASLQRTVIVEENQTEQNNESNNPKDTVKVSAQPVQARNGNNGKRGVIYLTFDDGPSTNITPQILDILKQKNVKATFFILNYNSEGEKLIKREHDEGHTIAIHGYSHDYYTIYKSEEAFMENVTKLEEKIKNSTGYDAKIIRFPGGSSNTVSRYNPGIMTILCNLVIAKGYKYFDWNISSGDAGGAKTADDVYNNVIKGLSQSKANVVLMHDFSSNSKVVEALPRIIEYGLANGYSFEAITEKTPMVTHKPNN